MHCFDGNSMTSNHGTVAALILAATWTLEQIAYDLPAGRRTNEQLATLADTLDTLATVLRAAAGTPQHALDDLTPG